MKAFLGAPIRQGIEELGTLYLTEKEGGEEFTPEDESLLVLFANQAAMAINNAQQYLQKAWWTATFPGVAICVMTLGVALIADGLNDALNPRLKEVG